MSEITAFHLVDNKNNLIVELDHSACFEFSYEYLRVFSPSETGNQNNPLVSHKKQVKVRGIECVGKKGYRLLFDDAHKAIYSVMDFITLHREYNMRWQHYLQQIAQSTQNREASIDIKQL